MREFKGIENLYLIGIGGIGMSALARYCLAGGYDVYGYDRTSTTLTETLEKEGCSIIFEEREELIPKDKLQKGKSLVIVTPAVPTNNKILNYFRNNNFRIYKRAEVLGMISESSHTLAIAGTHGKTSVSALTAHLLKQSTLDCTAFLGGISKNYNSNLITGNSEFVVVEADEYDRSFLRLSPRAALVTSIDPDHLEIYGNYKNLVQAFNEFAQRVSNGGNLIVNYKIREKIKVPSHVNFYTYGFDSNADFSISDYRRESGAYYFNIETPFGRFDDLVSLIPGRLNLENTLGAISLALISGVTANEIVKALLFFKGVVRRFDVKNITESVVLIDDYAHHPEELNFLIDSLKEFYAGKKITGIFQPHLYSRTRDYATEFATSLDRFDNVFILPVYPAREEPIKGISSALILDRMKSKTGKLITKEDIPSIIDSIDPEILVMIGAGDIDKQVKIVEEKLRSKVK